MPKLADLAPVDKKVNWRGTDIAVYGLSLKGAVGLFNRFPMLWEILNGKFPDADALSAAAPGAVSAIIAAGIGEPGVAEWEAEADKMPLDKQAEFIALIKDATLPSGVGPFVARLLATGLFPSLSAAPEPQASLPLEKMPASTTSSPPPSKS